VNVATAGSESLLLSSVSTTAVSAFAQDVSVAPANSLANGNALPMSLMAQAFSEMEPMLMQETTLGQPGAVLTTDLAEQTSQDKAIQQPLTATQQDWVPAELLDQMGQTKRGDGALDADADMAGLEEFFAREAVDRGM
jgi:hypothetical protein